MTTVEVSIAPIIMILRKLASGLHYLESTYQTSDIQLKTVSWISRQLEALIDGGNLTYHISSKLDKLTQSDLW